MRKGFDILSKSSKEIIWIKCQNLFFFFFFLHKNILKFHLLHTFCRRVKVIGIILNPIKAPDMQSMQMIFVAVLFFFFPLSISVR